MTDPHVALIQCARCWRRRSPERFSFGMLSPFNACPICKDCQRQEVWKGRVSKLFGGVP